MKRENIEKDNRIFMKVGKNAQLSRNQRNGE